MYHTIHVMGGNVDLFVGPQQAATSEFLDNKANAKEPQTCNLSNIKGSLDRLQ